MVIFVFSEKRLGGVGRRAYYLCARKLLRQQLRHGLCCAHPPLPLARVAQMVSPAVLLAANFARRALATSKEGVQVHWLGGRLCDMAVGGSLKAPTQRSERSTRLSHAQRLFTTYKRIVPNPNTATPLFVFHGAHARGLGAGSAATALFELPLALPWRRSSIWPRDMAVEWL